MIDCAKVSDICTTVSGKVASFFGSVIMSMMRLRMRLHPFSQLLKLLPQFINLLAEEPQGLAHALGDFGQHAFEVAENGHALPPVTTPTTRSTVLLMMFCPDSVTSPTVPTVPSVSVCVTWVAACVAASVTC